MGTVSLNTPPYGSNCYLGLCRAGVVRLCVEETLLDWRPDLTSVPLVQGRVRIGLRL